MKKLLFSIPEAAKMLGIGKNKMYEIVGSGLISVLKLGSMKITKQELERFVDSNMNMDLTNLDDIHELIEAK